MKKIPVYLSEQELVEIKIALAKVPYKSKLTEKEKADLFDKILENLLTFQEYQGE